MEQDIDQAPTRPCCAACRQPCSAGRDSATPDLVQPTPLLLASRYAAPAPVASLTSPQQLVLNDAVKITILLTSQMLNLPREAVMHTLQAGLPAIGRLAEVNPLLLARLYAASLRPLPEPLERFYTRLAESPPLRQALLDDYRATYGGMLDAANRAAGQRAGISDGQAREVMAVLLPAINHLLNAANIDGEAGYARLVRAFGA